MALVYDPTILSWLQFITVFLLLFGFLVTVLICVLIRCTTSRLDYTNYLLEELACILSSEPPDNDDEEDLPEDGDNIIHLSNPAHKGPKQ
jgi:hypothetical protein